MGKWPGFSDNPEYSSIDRRASLAFILVYLVIVSTCFCNPVFGQIQLGNDIDGEAAEDASGSAVSLSSNGEILAIGAPWNDANGEDAGHVRVYQWSGTDWVQLGNNIDGEAAGDRSGMTLALSAEGLRVAIGASGSDDNGDDSGQVRVYQWSGTKWSQIGNDIDGKAASDYLGVAVSLSADGNLLAAAANADDENWYKVGLVRVYEWTGAEWAQLGTDIRGEQEFDYFGGDVTLSSDGTRLAAGAIQNDGVNGAWSGHVRAFQWSGMNWVQMGDDVDGEAMQDHSGILSFSADGSRMAVGAILNDGGGENSGHVRVFQWTGTAWQQMGTDLAGEKAFDFFGSDVSLSADGNRLAIGAYGTHDNAGQVTFYGWSGATWVQMGNPMVGEAPGDESGESISLSADGNRVAIGVFRNDGNGADSGHVRVYDLAEFNEFKINAGLNDAWYYRPTDGQGFFITVFPNLGYVSMAWFTYDTELPPQSAVSNLGDPGHRWLTALGPIDGNRAVMDITLTSGGIFDTPSEITRTDPPGSDGTITLTFESCTAGLVEYDIPSIGRQGTIPIERIADDNIRICEALKLESHNEASN